MNIYRLFVFSFELGLFADNVMMTTSGTAGSDGLSDSFIARLCDIAIQTKTNVIRVLYDSNVSTDILSNILQKFNGYDEGCPIEIGHFSYEAELQDSGNGSKENR